jgi:hypothetical protein
MSGRYEYARSGREKSVLLIFPEGTFEALPFEVRLAAPWVGQGLGSLSELKAADRWHFHQRGYVILRAAVEAAVTVSPPEGTIAERPDLRQAA